MKMKLSMSLRFCVIITSLIHFDNGGEAINYGSLIKNVYDKYDSTGVIIASNVNHQSFIEVETIFEIQRKMSASNIPSVVINFEKLKERLEFYDDETKRPLVVIFIYGMNEVRNFETITRHINMNYSVWLVVFTGDNDKHSCKFCRIPTGNPFNLKFNSAMMISCCNSGYIEEWWSERKNHSNELLRGKWINDIDGIEWYSNDSINNRRYSLDRKEFRIAIIKGSGYVWQEDNRLHGYLGEIFNELSRAMNFTVSTIIEVSTSGSWHSETEMWSGIIGVIWSGKADIGVAEVTMTQERLEVVDFTLNVASGPCRLFIKKPSGSGVHWDAYIKVFNPDIWMIIIILLLIAPILLTIMKYKKKYGFFNMIDDHYLNVWCIFCQHGISEFPSEIPLRTVYISIFISSIVVSAAYSASLVSHLATTSPYLPFHTMEQFIDDGSYKLIVTRDSANHQMFMTTNNTVLRRMASLMKAKFDLPDTLEEGFKQVCNEKVAFFTNDALKEINVNLSCEVSHIVTTSYQSLGMIMPRNSEYTELINDHIQRFRTHGLMKRMRHKYYIKSIPAKDIYAPVQILDITSILLIFAVGFSIAIIIFLLERMLHQLNYSIRVIRRRRLMKRLLRKAESIHRKIEQKNNHVIMRNIGQGRKPKGENNKNERINPIFGNFQALSIKSNSKLSLSQN